MLKRIGIALGLLVLSVAVAVVRYRGPAPKGIDAPQDQPSAARMRATLEHLLGDPPQPHSTGTPEGEAFLQRLETRLESFGVTTERIVTPWLFETDPPDQKLKNLLVTLPGRDPNLKPLFVATHHDSCPDGPGAGDAGSALVALVENIRILADNQPLRTTQFLFTDGEEAGLQGAAAIGAMEELPIDEPVFVLNFDARGTFGGVPMFETHADNFTWTEHLLPHLAAPKITSSLAVTVYRMLPNATDFNIWNSYLNWPGFNYATIGGAHHYHRPSDSPENLSDRTLQHMGDHLYSMHRALDVNKLPDDSANTTAAVFFDIYGFFVIHYGESLQRIVAIIATLTLAILLWVQRGRFSIKAIVRHAVATMALVLLGCAIGSGVNLLLKTTPWAGVRYTPFDYAIGLATIALTLLATSMAIESFAKRIVGSDVEFLRDWTWLVTAILGVALAYYLPGGGYLLVWPALAYAVVRTMGQQNAAASWAGWTVMIVLIGPTLALLVQALGPWKQPIYSVIATLLAIQAMTAWYSRGSGAVAADATEAEPTG